jgi:hypothetical protein
LRRFLFANKLKKFARFSRGATEPTKRRLKDERGSANGSENQDDNLLEMLAFLTF